MKRAVAEGFLAIDWWFGRVKANADRGATSARKRTLERIILAMIVQLNFYAF